MVIFFESYSIIQVLLSLSKIRKCERISFMPDHLMWKKLLPFKMRKNMVLKLVSIINPKARIFNFNHDDYMGCYYEQNKFTNDIIGPFNSHELDKMRIKFLFDKEYYKAIWSMILPKCRVYDYLVLKISKDHSLYDMHSPYILDNLKLRIVLLFTPLIKALKYFKGIRIFFGRIWRKDFYKMLLHVIPPTGEHDRHLVGSFAKDVVYLFGYWKLDYPDEIKLKGKFDKEKIPYKDKKDFHLNYRALWYIFKCQLKIIKRVFTLPIDLDSTVYLYADLKAFHSLIEKKIEMENVGYFVELSRMDYNPAHILHTQLLNKEGRGSVGIAHSASIYDCPQLNYAVFNRYITVCPLYDRTFKTRYNEVHAGRDKLDNLKEVKEDVAFIKKRFTDKHGKSDFIASVFLPQNVDAINKGYLLNLYSGLVDISKLGINCKIVIRAKDVMHFKKMHNFLKLPLVSSIFVLDHHNFNTQEILLISDLVIATCASFVLNEAISINKKTFTFRLSGKEELYFPDYGNDFVLNNGQNLIMAFLSMVDKNMIVNVDYEKLKKSMDYYNDGRNKKRITDVCLDLCEVYS